MQEKKGKHQMMSTWKLMTMKPRLGRRRSRNQMRRKCEINA